MIDKYRKSEMEKAKEKIRQKYKSISKTEDSLVLSVEDINSIHNIDEQPITICVLHDGSSINATLFTRRQKRPRLFGNTEEPKDLTGGESE